jgi:thioredoxin 1
LVRDELGFTLRVRYFFLLTLLFCVLQTIIAGQSLKPAASNDDILDPVSGKKDLYAADADAKKEIDEALKIAAATSKRVMLVFGANWCYDCHVLDRALHEGAAGSVMKESFRLVHVDIGEGNTNPDLVKKYKINLDKGVPVVAILDSTGTVIYRSDAGEFEAARRMMKKDLVAFLVRWKETAR